MTEGFEHKLARMEVGLKDAHHPKQEELEEDLIEYGPSIVLVRRYIQAKLEAQIIFDIFAGNKDPLDPSRFDSSEGCTRIEVEFKQRYDRIKRLELMYGCLRDRYDEIMGTTSV